MNVEHGVGGLRVRREVQGAASRFDVANELPFDGARGGRVVCGFDEDAVDCGLLRRGKRSKHEDQGSAENATATNSETLRRFHGRTDHHTRAR